MTPDPTPHRETYNDGALQCFCPIGHDHTLREWTAWLAEHTSADGTVRP